MGKIVFFLTFSAMILHGPISIAQELYYYNASSISYLDLCTDKAQGSMLAIVTAINFI